MHRTLKFSECGGWRTPRSSNSRSSVPCAFVPLGERTGQAEPHPNAYSTGTGRKRVLLVPSSGQSVAELQKRFFTPSWVLSAFEKLFCNLSVALLLDWEQLLTPACWFFHRKLSQTLLGDTREFEIGKLGLFSRKTCSLQSKPFFSCMISS